MVKESLILLQKKAMSNNPTVIWSKITYCGLKAGAAALAKATGWHGLSPATLLIHIKHS